MGRYPIAMKAPLLLAAALCLAAPLTARAAGAIGQARAVSNDPASFDGAAVRPEGTPVPAGASTDGRTAEQIASDEQAKADARASSLKAATQGPDKEIEEPKPAEWSKSEHILSGVKGAMIGLLVGSLWGMTGLGVGVLVGGLLGYALSRVMS